MALNREKIYSIDHIQNLGFDKDFQIPIVHPIGYDGQNMVRGEADDLQTKILTSGDYTYICKAAVGTPEATAKWKIYRIDSAGSKMYADGNADFDNVATDPTALTYSYS